MGFAVSTRACSRAAGLALLLALLFGGCARSQWVVVLETDHERQILERIEQLQQLPGVLNVALIYHELLSPEGATA